MQLIIESFEGGLYLAYHQEKDHREVIRDEHHHPLRFKSLEEAQDYFHKNRYEQAWLLQDSAYDEMCGTSTEGHPPMLIDLKWH